MKTFRRISLITIAVIVLTGCAFLWVQTVPSMSAIKPAGKDRYAIKVNEGTGLSIYERWDQDAQKKCGSKKMVTTKQQYVSNPHGVNFLEGTFDCR
jgi:hypothetical protein